MESTAATAEAPCIPPPHHRPAVATGQTSSQTPRTKQPIFQPSTEAPELCPPHRRRPRPGRKHYRSTVKTLVRRAILKDFDLSASSSSPARASAAAALTPRPAVMRMKDSDDYITARAANPRTGQISPSIAGSPRTPGTPAEALKIRAASPTAGAKRQQPGPCQANQGRKIEGGGGGIQRWHADGAGWTGAGQLTSRAASPAVATVTAGGYTRAGAVGRPPLRDDQFVVHMPSAQEPQPYAFPGHSAAQIEAYEHYKRKARRTSGEGYDQRLLQNARKVAGGECAKGGDAHAAFPTRPAFVRGEALKGGIGAAGIVPQSIAVMKTRGGRQRDEVADRGCDLETLGAASFAPYRSPRTPKVRNAFVEVSTRMRKMPGSFRDITPDESSWSSSSCCAPLAQDLPMDVLQASSGAASEGASTTSAYAVSHLSQLPRVNLVHPSLAGVPGSHSVSEGSRKCSLGCRRAGDGDMCSDQRGSSFDRDEKRRRIISEDQHAYMYPASCGGPDECGTSAQLVELGAMAASFFWHTCQEISRSNANLLDKVLPHFLSMHEKLLVLRNLILLVGQGVALFLVVALIWKVATASLQVVSFFLWPVGVLFRIMQWLAGG